MAAWLAWSTAMYEYSEGDDWGPVMEAVAEAVAGSWTPADEARFLYVDCLFRVARADPAGDALARLEELVGQVSDPSYTAALDEARGDRALVAGDYTAAYEALIRAADTNSAYEPFALSLAVRAALWMGDVERARAAAARTDASPFSGATAQVDRLAARAGIAALEGRVGDAIAGYREVLRRRRALDLHFETARSALDFVLLVGPDAPEARAAADEARAIFERLRARPYLERLAAALGEAAVTA